MWWPSWRRKTPSVLSVLWSWHWQRSYELRKLEERWLGEREPAEQLVVWQKANWDDDQQEPPEQFVVWQKANRVDDQVNGADSPDKEVDFAEAIFTVELREVTQEPESLYGKTS